MEQTIIKGWVARDKFCNRISIYTGARPVREKGMWLNDGNIGASRMFIDNTLFPELKWEDEPVEVELIIRKL